MLLLLEGSKWPVPLVNRLGAQNHGPWALGRRPIALITAVAVVGSAIATVSGIRQVCSSDRGIDDQRQVYVRKRRISSQCLRECS